MTTIQNVESRKQRALRENFFKVEANLNIVDEKLARLASAQSVRELFARNSHEHNNLTCVLSQLYGEISSLIQATKCLQIETEILLREQHPANLDYFLNRRDGVQRNS